MGGDHRRDPGSRQQRLDLAPPNTFRVQRADRASQGVRLIVARQRPVMLDLVLGQVGDLQEAGERMGEAHRLLQAQRRQLVVDPDPAATRLAPVEIHRGLADRLDLIEHRLAVLSADDVAEDTAEEAHGGAGLVGFRGHGVRSHRLRQT